MLPKNKRVTKATFQSLMKERRLFSTQFFLFYHKKNELPQYSFVAPKAIFKASVKRNKYRRLGYNILRALPLKQGIGIFVYKKQAVLATQQEIKEEVFFILNKNKLLE